MKRQRGKRTDTAEAPAGDELALAAATGATEDASTWDGPTRAGEVDEIASLAAASLLDLETAGLDADGETSPESEPLAAAAPDVGEGGAGVDVPAPLVESAGRLESILESLLYAADRPLSVSDLKRLVNERDAKKVAAALEALRERHADTGIQLASLAGGWQFRTHPDNGPWVAKLVAGRPQRLTRAMLEALAIVAYRQPITRPEIDEIRGVDCGPVLKTLLDRGFIRILGKKEDVGRPMLYGTTPEFLRTFSLRDLSELPTLREFHELSEQQMASVDAQAPLPEGAQVASAAVSETAPSDDAAPAGPAGSAFAPAPLNLAPIDRDEEDDLLAALDEATLTAARAAGPPPGSSAEGAGPEASEAS